MDTLPTRPKSNETMKDFFLKAMNNQERLSYALGVGEIGSFEWRLSDNTVYLSPELEKLYGLKPGTFSGKFEDIMKIVHPEDALKMKNIVEKYKKNGDVVSYEFRVMRPDGSIRWMLSKSELKYDQKKKPSYILGVNIDITDRKQVENNLIFLSQASKLLASSLDYQTTLNSVVKLAVPHISDWCAVDMYDGNNVKLVAVAHKDPKKVKWARELRKNQPTDMSSPTGLPNVLRTGKSEIYPVITEEMIIAAAKNERELKLLREIGFNSVMIVPICNDKSCIGAITFVNTETKRAFTPADLAMAEELGSRASLSIQNAQLYASAQKELAERKKIEKDLKQREQDFRVLSDSMPQLVWVTDGTGKTEYLNNNWFEYSKKSTKEKTHTLWHSLIHPDDNDAAMKAWQKALKTGQNYEAEFRLLNGKTKTYHWFLGRGVPMKDENGTIIKWFGTCTDIDEQKKTQEALIRSEAQFKALYDANIIGVMYFDLKGNILQANDAFLHIIGITRKEIETGKIKWDDITPPDYWQEDQKAIKDLLTKGYAQPWEKEYTRKDGSPVPVIVGAALLNKDTTETISFVLDITERKKLEQRKDEFIGIASHELKTPLTSIKGYVQILERIIQQMGDDKAKLYLEKTNAYVERLNSLISDLLDVSKIQAGKLQMNFTEFDFDDLVNDGMESVRHFDADHAVIKEGEVHQKIKGDRHRLEQVFTNLLSNAIKYSPDADKVIIKVSKHENEVQIQVQDFGVGIPKNKQSKLFDRFYRVEETSKQFSGLGIGLYISCEIIQRHGGKLWVESEPGKGSTFFFTLPIVRK
jgi:PAS domain S-box-containing protein